MVLRTEHPRYGVVSQPASQDRVGTEKPTYRRAPQRKEDFSHVVHDLLCYGEDRVTELTVAGAFGHFMHPQVDEAAAR